MRDNALVGIGVLVLAQALYGCGGTGSSPTPFAPSPVAQAAPAPPPRPGPWPDGYTLTAVSLSGAVYEVTSTGRVPMPGVQVYCELCGTETHTFARADANGFYSFPAELASGGGVWLSGAPTPLLVFVDINAYRDPPGLPPLSRGCPSGLICREVLIDRDTHFDIELVRR